METGPPYWIILPILVGRLAVQHVLAPAASLRSKGGVVAAFAGALLLAVTWKRVLPASLLLTGVGAYILLHRVASSDGDHAP